MSSVWGFEPTAGSAEANRLTTASTMPLRDVAVLGSKSHSKRKSEVSKQNK